LERLGSLALAQPQHQRADRRQLDARFGKLAAQQLRNGFQLVGDNQERSTAQFQR
jgi:hypothetical protein